MSSKLDNRHPSYLPPSTRIFVAGHKGIAGSVLVRKLQPGGHTNIITSTQDELNLTEKQSVRDFFHQEKIDYVVLDAAKVGGIHANNTYPAWFIAVNLQIQTNIIHEAYKAGIDKLLFLGSSCIYPKHAPQPLKVEYLLTGQLEPTNEPYAIAKIAGIKMCEAYNRQYGTDFRSVMPTNLYGPGDNYDLENSHVIPAMIRKFHLAKLAMKGDIDGIQKNEVTFGPIPLDIKEALGVTPDISHFVPDASPKVVLCDTGKDRREFLHIDDMAAACVFVITLAKKDFCSHSSSSFLNVGHGIDVTVAEAEQPIAKTVGYRGELLYDPARPDGTPRKIIDIGLLQNTRTAAKNSAERRDNIRITTTYRSITVHMKSQYNFLEKDPIEFDYWPSSKRR